MVVSWAAGISLNWLYVISAISRVDGSLKLSLQHGAVAGWTVFSCSTESGEIKRQNQRDEAQHKWLTSSVRPFNGTWYPWWGWWYVPPDLSSCLPLSSLSLFITPCQSVGVIAKSISNKHWVQSCFLISLDDIHRSCHSFCPYSSSQYVC